MKKLIVLLVILISLGNPVVAQLHPAYKILYTTTDETIGGKSEISHEVLVNDDKVKMVMRSVFPNRIFLSDKKKDTSTLLFPSLSQYVQFGNVNKIAIQLRLVPNKTKTIASYQCKLAQVKINATEGGVENDTLDIWYTEELPLVYWAGFDELSQIPGATLQITTPTGIEMVAQSVVKSELNDNDFIIPKEYEQIDEAYSPLEKNKQIGDNLFLYQDDKTGFYGLQDDNQKKITPAQYLDFGTFQNGICLVQYYNQKFGAIDLLGNEVIPFKYDYIICDNDANQFIVAIDEKYGVMNREGKTLLPIQYEYISFLNNGYAAFSVDRKFGIVNENNQIIVPASYQVIYTNNSTHFIAMADNNYKLINIKTNKTVANGYDYISTTDEPNLFLAQKDGNFGYLDGTGKIVIPLIYNNATTFRDGEAYVITAEDEAIIINTKGEKVKSVLAPQDELNDEEKEALRNIEKASKDSMEAVEKKKGKP